MPEPLLTRSQLRKATAIATIGYPFVAALGRTLRWRVEGWEHHEALRRSGRQPIYAFWHGRIFPGMHYFRDRGIVVITSLNFDGEWIAQLLTRFGYGTARGSTSRGGSRALVQLRRDLRAGRGAAFTLDGPRGPARVAQPGAVWLAGATGHAILPFHFEASRFWEMRSWDRTQIPKPFATIGFAIGEPVVIQGTSPEQVEEGQRRLETTLAALEVRARELISDRM